MVAIGLHIQHGAAGDGVGNVNDLLEDDGILFLTYRKIRDAFNKLCH